MLSLATIGHEVKAIARSVPRLSGQTAVFANHGGSMAGGVTYGPLNLGHQLVQPSQKLDLNVHVGDPMMNGVVAACVNAKARALADAPLLLEQRTPEGWATVDDHKCLELLREPNPDHSDADIWGLTNVWQSTRGQAFWIVLPNKQHRPGEIHVWNPERVRILGDEEHFIRAYEIQREGGGIMGDNGEWGKEGVIHFRHLPNPLNSREGWNPINAGRTQIAGDNMSATYQASILLNAGVVSLLIGLREAVSTGSGVTPEQFETAVNNIRNATLENAGGVNGINLPLEVHKMAYSPDEMGLTKLIEYYETRICSVMGVSQRVAGLGADPTYLNLKEALQDFWERTMVPARNADAATLNRQWLPLYGMSARDWRFRFDYSGVAALQENKDEMHTRVREDYKVGGLDLKQYRALTGYAGEDEEEEKYNEVFFKGMNASGAEEPQSGEAQLPKQN